jgi:cysteinyl-tRNA synthetase
VAAGAGDDAVELDAEPMATYRSRFLDAISDDLGLPAALALAHAVAGSDDLIPAHRRALLLDFDRVFGLDLDAPAEVATELPEGAAALLERRAAARTAREWAVSDALRDELAALGVDVRDTPDGQIATARRSPS